MTANEKMRKLLEIQGRSNQSRIRMVVLLTPDFEHGLL
jgi:hypothetical protein